MVMRLGLWLAIMLVAAGPVEGTVNVVVSTHDGLVVTASRSNQCLQTQARQAPRLAAYLCGLPGNAECHIRTIQELMGHSDIHSTLIYLNLQPAHYKEAVGKLPF